MITRPLLICALVAALFGVGIGVNADEVTLGSSKDNTLYEDPNGLLSNGAGMHFFTGRTANALNRRGVIAFDVASAIPAGSTIDEVQLTLHMSRTISGGQPVALHALTRDWGEAGSDASGAEGAGAPAEPGDATWIHTFFDTDFWDNPGGDFNPSASATTTVAGTGFYTWGSNSSMVADVQRWLDDPARNFGWIVIGNESQDVTAKRFDTKENSTADFRPALTVVFTPPVQTETICPSDSTINRGIVASGDISNLCESDDADWAFQPDALAATLVAPINIELRGDAPGESTGELRFMVEVAATETGVVQRIELFNFTTQQWEGTVFTNIDTSDRTYMVTRADASDYISDDTNAVRSRVSYFRPAGVPPFWNVEIDQAIWEIDF